MPAIELNLPAKRTVVKPPPANVGMIFDWEIGRRYVLKSGTVATCTDISPDSVFLRWEGFNFPYIYTLGGRYCGLFEDDTNDPRHVSHPWWDFHEVEMAWVEGKDVQYAYIAAPEVWKAWNSEYARQVHGLGHMFNHFADRGDLIWRIKP